MRKRFGVFIITLAGALLIWGIVSIARLIIINNNGSKIIAKVLQVDADCDRYDKIDVVHQGKAYQVIISRTDCHDGVYKVGQDVTLIRYKDNDTLVWPEARYEWLPFLLLALLAMPYFTNKNKFRDPKKPTPNTVLAKKRLSYYLGAEEHYSTEVLTLSDRTINTASSPSPSTQAVNPEPFLVQSHINNC